MNQNANSQDEYDVIVIGGGQAGLAASRQLQKHGVDHLVLDASERIGDSWRNRWDSLRLFTPAAFSSLEGMPFPARPMYFPTKDEFADYLESYAAKFGLPVRSGSRVLRLSKEGGRYVVETRQGALRARQVIVAMANYQRPKLPGFATEMAPDVRQFHSSEYKNPSQLPQGAVLLTGAGNSGAEIGLELSRTHRVYLAGSFPGEIPFPTHGKGLSSVAIRFTLGLLFHRILTLSTPIGRKAQARIQRRAGPLIRVKGATLKSAGVQRVARVVGASEGRPLLEDGTVLDVAAVVWCTGYRPAMEWIDLPLESDRGLPVTVRGVVPGVPGLYFVGLMFQYAMSSAMVMGVSRDAAYVAERVVDALAGRTPATTPAQNREAPAALPS